MNPSLEALIRLELPPLKPVAPGSADMWRTFEQRLSATVPQDYKDYLGVYGAGQWIDFFGAFDPFYQWKHPQAPEYFRWKEMRVGSLGRMRKEFPQYTAPFDVFPSPNGLLPFVYDDNGGTICWQVRGEPNSWPLVCLDGKLSEEFDVFEMSWTEFLVALLTQKIFPKTFPPDLFPIPKPAFRSFTNQ